MGDETNEQSVRDALLEKLEKSALDINSREALFLPYEVFKQYNALVTENMKQIYNMLHHITMSKNVVIEFAFGDVNFSMTGPAEDFDKLTEKSEDMVKIILKRLTSKTVIRAIRPEKQETGYDDRKGYG